MWGCCPIKCSLPDHSCIIYDMPNTAYTCSLSSDSGRTCGAATSRWYYDTSDQRCVSFTYYGCDGNPNNFASKYLCEVYCGVGGWIALCSARALRLTHHLQAARTVASPSANRRRTPSAYAARRCPVPAATSATQSLRAALPSTAAARPKVGSGSADEHHLITPPLLQLRSAARRRRRASSAAA